MQKARTTPELKAAFDRLAKRTDLTPDERLREEFRLELPLNFHTPRKQGFIDYNGHLHVHKALLTFLRGPSPRVLTAEPSSCTRPLYQAR